MRRKKFRKGGKFGNGTEKSLQVVVSKDSDMHNLCKLYKTQTLLHGDMEYTEYRKFMEKKRKQ